MLIGAFLEEKEKSGFWSIGATVVFFTDALLVAALIYLLYARMSWTARVNGLTIVGLIPICFGALAISLDDQKARLALNLVSNGGAVLAVILCGLWLRTQNHLR